MRTSDHEICINKRDNLLILKFIFSKDITLEFHVFMFARVPLKQPKGPSVEDVPKSRRIIDPFPSFPQMAALAQHPCPWRHTINFEKSKFFLHQKLWTRPPPDCRRLLWVLDTLDSPLDNMLIVEACW